MRKDKLARLFAALGEPTRLTVIARLGDGVEHSISTIGIGLPISRQALTKHLQVLETAGVASSRRRGRETVYWIDPGGMVVAEKWIADVSAQWDNAIDRLKRSVESE